MKKFLLLPVSIAFFTVISFSQNNSLQFNGNGFTGPYVNVSTNSNDFNLGTAFTLEAWINPTTGSNGNQTIVSKGDNNGSLDGGYILQVQGGTLQFYNALASASPYWFNSGIPIPNNTWTHVAVSYSLGSLRFFVNGGLVSTQAVTMNLNPGLNDFYIGRQGFGCQCNKFYGQIDEVRVWNVSRTNTEIYNSYNKDLAGTESGLVAYYQFNQGSANGTNTGLTSLTDIAGTANTGTLNSFALSGTLSNWVNGVVYLNNALNFDGANDIVDVPYNSKLNLNANPFTIEYWARPTLVDGTNHWIINKGTGNSDVDYLLGITSNNKFTFIARNLGVFFNGTSTPVAGTWYHVANVFDGISAKIYVNGVLEATSTTLGTASANTTGLRIGARTESGVPSQYFQGDIDEIRIWNIALSQNEIQTNRSKNVTSTTPGLVAYYEFNQGVPAGTNTGINTAKTIREIILLVP
ncbi:MAG: LamG domain-containing protein [Cytophagales bacterium]|nr:LamG domain-containing protein [Cytophagales bacterium]